MTAQGEYQVIPLDKLSEPPDNPRQHTDPKKLEELAASIKERGVLEPILVRPYNSGYQLVFGWRRYKASLAVGQTTIPAIVREMDDREAVEIQNIENLQREDVHPLDEGYSYRRLIEKAGYDLRGLASKLHKTPMYLIQRIKLTDLIPEAQKLLLAGTLTPAHGFVISRLQADKQKDVLKWAVVRDEGEIEVRPAAVVDRYIKNEIILDLHNAPWRKDDELLYPQAGPCTTCPKRTGNAPALFPGLKGDICTDPTCFAVKFERFIEQTVEGLNASELRPPLRISAEYGGYGEKKRSGVITSSGWHKSKPGACQYARSAVVVEEGYMDPSLRRGQVVTVCAEGKCKVHFAGRPDAEGRRKTPAQVAGEKRAKTRRLVESQVRQQLLTQVEEKVRWPLTVDDLRLVASEYFADVWHEARKRICLRMGLEPGKQQYGRDYDGPVKRAIAKMDAPALGKFLVTLALARDTTIPSYAPNLDTPATLLATAKRYGVNPEKVRREVVAAREKQR